MKSENEILNRIYNLSGDPEETRDAYKDWAENYDDDTVGGMGYVGPAVASEKLRALSVAMSGSCEPKVTTRSMKA